MTDKELLREAANEIKLLRVQNEKMSSRLEVFDSMMRLFHTSPNWGREGGMHPDIVWEIENALNPELSGKGQN